MASYSNHHTVNRMNVSNHVQYDISMENKPNEVSCSNKNNSSASQRNHDPNRKVTYRRKIPPPSSTNMQPINSPSSAVRRVLSSNDSDDDFQQILNKKKMKRKQKQAMPLQVHQSNVSPSLDINRNATTFSPSPHPTVPGARVSTNNHHGNKGEHHHNQQSTITNESARYALTRFPFPPYILRFKAGKVTPNQVKEGLISHCNMNHQMLIQIANCRLSNATLNNNEYDILLYLKDVVSFSFLLNQSNWPNLLVNESYALPSLPSIPPQLCLLIKNVDLRLDFDDFCSEVKTLHPQIKNVIRMKNKFQNDIKLVKLELTSPAVREELLNEKRIIINYVTYDIDEYLAPAYVLICSKCMALGHFKRQCTQVNETCRTCGEQAADLKNHNCSQIEKCIHCQQNHKSNSLKCPVVKSFRSELTRRLLQLNNSPPPPAQNSNVNNYTHVGSNFPHLPVPQVLQNNPMMDKLDDLIGKMSEVKDHLANLTLKHEKFEQFILEKNQNDERMKESIEVLSKNVSDLKKDVVQHSILIERHENLFVKLLFPMFDDLFNVIAGQNQDKRGNPLDADLKCKLERYRIQMKKTIDGKNFIQ